MLHCVYHPTGELRVVEDEEKDSLIATGVWFDHPLKAKEARENNEKRIFNEGKQRGRKVKESIKHDGC